MVGRGETEGKRVRRRTREQSVTDTKTKKGSRKEWGWAQYNRAIREEDPKAVLAVTIGGELATFQR